MADHTDSAQSPSAAAIAPGQLASAPVRRSRSPVVGKAAQLVAAGLLGLIASSTWGQQGPVAPITRELAVVHERAADAEIRAGQAAAEVERAHAEATATLTALTVEFTTWGLELAVDAVALEQREASISAAEAPAANPFETNGDILVPGCSKPPRDEVQVDLPG